MNKEKRNTAGAKAPSDITDICRRLGYRVFSFPGFPRDKSKLFQKIWLLISGTWNWIRFKNTIEDNSVVIFQHPMYGNRLTERMVPLIKRRKNAKFVALIHDLESLRGGIAGVTEVSARTREMSDNSLLKKFDVIICHNEHMRQYLAEHGFSPDKLINLDIFDYLTGVERVQPEKCDTPSIAIAGNLAIGKCAYIYNIFENGSNRDLKVNLYGINFEESRQNSNMVYHGSFKPEELPEKLDGDFGLVWDGNSAATCAGNTGEYLKYNNPHKTSLYLASGMPVIVWRQAAIADFVLQNEVGIVVDSLYEIEDKINQISPADYSAMCSKVQAVSDKIRNGYYTEKALGKAVSVL